MASSDLPVGTNSIERRGVSCGILTLLTLIAAAETVFLRALRVEKSFGDFPDRSPQLKPLHPSREADLSPAPVNR